MIEQMQMTMVKPVPKPGRQWYWYRASGVATAVCLFMNKFDMFVAGFPAPDQHVDSVVDMHGEWSTEPIPMPEAIK